MNICMRIVLFFFLFSFIGVSHEILSQPMREKDKEVTVTCTIRREDNQPVIITIEIPSLGEPVLHSSVMGSHDITSDCVDECELHDPECDPDFDFEALLNDEQTKQKQAIDSATFSTQVTDIQETPQHIVLTLATGEQNFSGSSIIESGNGEISVVVAKE